VAHQTIPAVVIANLGNPNLKPESALTLTYGAVLTPTFLPGFSLSADYYRIKINGYISSPGASTSIDNCYNGLTSFCSNFVYTPPVGGAATGTIVVYQPGVNYSANVKSGWDFEAQYKTTLFDNPLSLHLLANTITTDYSVAPLATPINSQGTDGSPSWRMTGQVGYKIGAWFVQFQERYISPAKMSATLIQGISIDNNRIPAYFISDLTVNYDLDIAGSNSQLYLTINNLFNRAPPPDFTIPTSFSQPTNRSVYDGIGQYFNFGIRFKL
jgi:outer membrane receptor protein involved in Fe transport